MNPRWLLLAYAVANAVLYSMLLPLWEGFDEPFHFGYVQHLANGDGFPDPRTSRLSQEVGSSLLLAPASLAVQRNLPEVISYAEFFAWPESKRQQVRRMLDSIDPSLRWRPSSHFVNYEALQAPLAFAALALPERALARLPLRARVLVLRMIAGILGALLLFFGTERLAGQLGIRHPYQYSVIFCALSCQMLWASLAHVANDWLAVPLSIWLLVMVIHYNENPTARRAAHASVVLSMGLLTKAYFLAFIPLVILVCVFRRKWRDLSIALAIILVLAGPWYMRNVERYGTISGMLESREGADAMGAWQAMRVERLPAAFDGWARAALWTANNTFRTFSVNTLRALMATWLAALFLWAATKHRRGEWIVLLFSGLFFLALAYDTALDYVYSHGEATSPRAWYFPVLLAPMLSLGLLGAGRLWKAGRFVGALMMLLFGYILVATYWVKLIPLYSGFAGRASISALVTLYGERFSMLMAGLNHVCLAPAPVILSMAALVSVLAVGQLAILVRLLLVSGRGKSREPLADARGSLPRGQPFLVRFAHV